MSSRIQELNLSLTSWLQSTLGVEQWDVWHLITELGSAQALLIIIGTTLWLHSTRAGIRLLVGVLVAGVLVDILKVTIASPRPYYVITEIQAWRDSTGFGMPSGHAAAAMTLWGLLATEIKRWWFACIAVSLIALIGISRIYFGVHTPLQVLMGWLTGLIVVLGMVHWSSVIVRTLDRLSLWSQLTLATSSTLVLILLQLVVFQHQGDNFPVPENWQQRYQEALNFEAAREGEIARPEALKLYTAFDATQTGVILGAWLLAILVLQLGGSAGFDRQRRTINCLVGIAAVVIVFPLLEFTRQIPVAGFLVWVLIPPTLGFLVPDLAARLVRKA
ncbi:MAG: phosphatase PAP2 family protein [Granulosicoccus sp.]|nr:phosphatase PAP2 family protein [Granulosicoccus sp.]